jgi:hypothetical protein
VQGLSASRFQPWRHLSCLSSRHPLCKVSAGEMVAGKLVARKLDCMDCSLQVDMPQASEGRRGLEVRLEQQMTEVATASGCRLHQLA